MFRYVLLAQSLILIFFYSLLSTIINADFRKAWNKLSFITPVCLPNPKLMSPHSKIKIWTCTLAKNNTVDFKNNCFKSTWFRGCCFFSLFIYGIFVHLSLKFLMHFFLNWDSTLTYWFLWIKELVKK